MVMHLRLIYAGPKKSPPNARGYKDDSYLTEPDKKGSA